MQRTDNNIKIEKENDDKYNSFTPILNATPKIIKDYVSTNTMRKNSSKNGTRNGTEKRSRNCHRERCRVQKINEALEKLNSLLPASQQSDTNGKHYSKAVIIETCADFIAQLENHISGMLIESGNPLFARTITSSTTTTTPATITTTITPFSDGSEVNAGPAASCEDTENLLMDKSDEPLITAVCKPARIKRPKNSFILFSMGQRKQLLSDYPWLDNNSVSKILGDRWKNLDKKTKSKFSELARVEKAKHQIEFPGFNYSVKRRRPKPITKKGLDSYLDEYISNPSFLEFLDSDQAITIGRMLTGNTCKLSELNSQIASPKSEPHIEMINYTGPANSPNAIPDEKKSPIDYVINSVCDLYSPIPSPQIETVILESADLPFQNSLQETYFEDNITNEWLSNKDIGSYFNTYEHNALCNSCSCHMCTPEAPVCQIYAPNYDYYYCSYGPPNPPDHQAYSYSTCQASIQNSNQGSTKVTWSSNPSSITSLISNIEENDNSSSPSVPDTPQLLPPFSGILFPEYFSFE